MKETSKVNLVFVIFSIIPHDPTFSPFQIVRKTLLEERVSRLKSEKSWLQTFTAALVIFIIISSVRSSYSHPDLLLITSTTPLFQITPVLNTGLSLSEPLQLYKGYNAI